MRHVLSICHEASPQGEKRTRTQRHQLLGQVTPPNRTRESLGHDGYILWKTFPLSSEQVYYAPLAVKNPEKYRLSCLFTVKRRAGMAGLRTLPTQYAPQKRKTRPGGQPDGSSYMGAGVDGRSRRIQPRWGGIAAPTVIGRGGLAKRSKRPRIFLLFEPDFLDAKLFRGAMIGGACGRLIRRDIL
jgi:hypothetical protein